MSHSKVLSSKSIAELIQEARKIHHLSPTTLGKFFEPEIPPKTLERWEKGDLLPSRRHLPKIAALLNLTWEQFLELVGEQLGAEGNDLWHSPEEMYVPNHRQLRVFNKGVKAWNLWQEKNYQLTIQLAGVKPKEEDLEEINLSYADLRGANLAGKSLRRSQLQGADLRGANLTRANLSQANLKEANLSEAIMVEVSLREANCNRVNFSYVDLTCADLRNAILNQSNFNYAVLKYCYVYGVSTWELNLKGAVQKKLNICPEKTKFIYVNELQTAYLKFLD